MKPKDPASADVRVGMNIRQLRLRSGMSQEALADKIGVTFQQVQKYEKGANRVSASRLAAVFDAPIETLFSGATADLDSPADALPAMSRDALSVAQDFDAIENPAVRLTIRGLVKSLSKQPPMQPDSARRRRRSSRPSFHRYPATQLKRFYRHGTTVAHCRSARAGSEQRPQDAGQGLAGFPQGVHPRPRHHPADHRSAARRG
ncbi:helix-turn-helix domain-containing protein [Rhizobium leguminosarum]|uniref:helix-turn-helix domain-containing protein n=1 Tax=Rhizobium leguminosarum TaxID=384 RepID=UPI001FD96470|nr:helix-turn-helix transcriptional regulator [Rhizobium leguminosarum]